MRDDLGDRIKERYEGPEASRRFDRVPIIVRIDGKAFSTYTRGMHRPYDVRMMAAMDRTTEWLVSMTNARIGYTQSDEITLVFYEENPKTQVYFDGRVQKILSVTAAMASVRFNREVRDLFGPDMPDAIFDARAHEVPTLTEAANVLLWRERDATRNSVSMLAHHYFGHSAITKKTVPEMKVMLAERGTPWESEPERFRIGAYFQRQRVLREFTADELTRIPVQFHPKPGAMIERSAVTRLEPLPCDAPIGDRVAFVFSQDGEEALAV